MTKEGWLAVPNKQNIKKYGWKKQVDDPVSIVKSGKCDAKLIACNIFLCSCSMLLSAVAKYSFTILKRRKTVLLQPEFLISGRRFGKNGK